MIFYDLCIQRCQKRKYHDKTEERGSLRLDHDCSARPLKGVCVRTIRYAWEYRSEKRLFDVTLDDWKWKSFFASMEHDEWNGCLRIDGWLDIGSSPMKDAGIYEKSWSLSLNYSRWAIGIEAALLSTVYLIQSTVLSKSNPIAKTRSVWWWILRPVIATEPYSSQYIFMIEPFLLLKNKTL